MIEFIAKAFDEMKEWQRLVFLGLTTFFVISWIGMLAILVLAFFSI